MDKAKKYIKDKAKQALKYCKENKVRILIAAVIFAVVYGLSIVNMGFGINKRTLLMTGLCFFIALFVAVPRPKKWYYSLPVMLLFLLWVPGKLFDRIELPVHDLSGLIPGAEVTNVLIIILIYALIMLITQNVGVAFGAGTVIIGFFAVLNYYVVLFRGVSLGYADLFAGKTAMTVIDSYEFSMEPELWYSILYILFFAAWGFWCSKRWESKKIYHIAISAVAVLYIGFFAIFWFGTDYLEEHQLKGIHWTPSLNQPLEGFLLSFAINVQESYIQKPVGYSDGRIEEIRESAVANYQSPDLKTDVTNPNVILIMNEAWSDINILGDIELSESYMTTVEGLNDNAVKGNLYVPVLGGLTCNTEYEVLTGNTMALMPQNSVPYSLNVKDDIYSLARVMEEQGYESLAVHPNPANAWNRDLVYDYMGFDDFIDIYKFGTEYGYVRGYISDECDFNEIIYRFENKEEDTPLFLFNVTIQNHSGYGGGTDKPITINTIGGLPKEECGDLVDVRTYIDLMKITDEEFSRLIEYFRNVDEPTIICMFGDHQPSLSDNFYSHIFRNSTLTAQEQEAQKYITPYVIWANYDVEFPEYGDMSSNYLGAAVLECAGVELPPYYKFLLEMQKTYPIVTQMNVNELQGNEMLNDYEMLQYNHLSDDYDALTFGVNPEAVEEEEETAEETLLPWYEKGDAVCHALGAAPGGETLTNSYEALTYNYDNGFRVFEVDLAITSDDVVVLRHDWYSDLGQAGAFGWNDQTELEVPNAELFLSTPIYGQYTPMTLLDLYKYMDENEDVYIILDSKSYPDRYKQFSLIVNTAINNGLEHVLDRVTVQLYYEQMYEEVEAVYPFDNYIYTLYMIGYDDPDRIGEFCKENNIPVLVMPYEWMGKEVVEDMENYPVQLYVHTVNDVNVARDMIFTRVDGIYTDVITEKEIDKMEKDLSLSDEMNK